MTEGSTVRVAVVTGGSRGIGKAVAIALADQGAAVVVGYVGNEAGARDTVATITAAGRAATAVKADVADETEVAAMFDLAQHMYGGVDVVVNSAGRGGYAPLKDLDLDELDAIHRTNIRGTFVVAREAARRIRDHGAIVNLSTSVVRLRFPAYGAYAASKGAVEAMSLILAREMRGRDVTVNAVAPGPVATEFFFEGKTDAQIEGSAKSSPQERLGTPEDIARVVAFVASPDGHWINGQTVQVNGGAI